ncbi:MAG: sterol desaturase family protein [Hyphomicrobiales bacterium]|nr:sterol desaturase family protein [Hyphomicrobiales bacterium]
MIATFLKHGSNSALALGALALLVWSALGGPALAPGWIALGAALFFGSEYLWHRFAFHAPPSGNETIHRLQRRLHYDHHVEPARLDLLFLPLWFLAPVLAANAAIFWMVFGGGAIAPIVLGVLIAILYYEWVHYIAHIPYQPKTAWGRYIKRYHLRHHFISEKYWYGVSNPAFDYVYGTAADPKKVEKSPNVRNLFGDRPGADLA